MGSFAVITHQQFANKAWQRYSSYAFADKFSVIPIVAAELVNAAVVFPLGFVKKDASFQLVAITSLQPGNNLYVAPNGDWMGRYTPALLRCHPFSLVSSQDKVENILCIDEGSGLVVDAGRGEPFFDEGGKPGHALKAMVDFISQFEASRLVTQRAVDALQAANLIEKWPITTKRGDQEVVLEGFYRIDETMLNACPDIDFISLRAAGSLPLAYAQLLSMSQLGELRQAAERQLLLREQLQAQAANQSKSVADLGFRFPAGETFKFS